MSSRKPIRFLHALPNAWLPVDGKRLLLDGISVEQLVKMVSNAHLVSHIRYQDHCDRINSELGTALQESGINCPSPFNSRDTFIVASLSPGSSQVIYVKVWDATATLEEAEVW